MMVFNCHHRFIPLGSEITTSEVAMDSAAKCKKFGTQSKEWTSQKSKIDTSEHP